jgi:soluble lytic murein transglycosylase
MICLVALFALAPWLAAAPSSAQPPSIELAARRAAVHDDAGALEILGRLPRAERVSPRARYLEGRLLARNGEPARAAEALAIHEGLPAPVMSDARFRRAWMLARAGDCAGARPLLVELETDRNQRGARARALLAECALETDREDAIRRLREVAREDAGPIDTFAVRLLLAEALVANGDGAGAIAELEALRVERPEHPDAAAVEELLRARGVTRSLRREEHMQRAERFIALRDHAHAIEELDRAGRPTARDELARWLHLRGTSLFNTRQRYEEAASVLREASRVRGSPTALEDEFFAARALARCDRDAESIRAFRRYASAHPRDPRAVEAAYLAAWLEIRKRRAAGEAAMRRFLAGPGRSDAGFRREATWHLAFSAFERRRWADAARGFEAYSRLGDGGLVRGRGTYWAARAKELDGERAAAVTLYRDAMLVEPLHWYALLARERLIGLGETPGDPFGPPSPARSAPEPIEPPSLPGDASFYASLGLHADAVASVRGAEEGLRASAPRGRALERVIAAYAMVGDVARSYELAASAHDGGELQRRPDAANRWIWSAAYPRAYERVVEPIATAEAIDPEYLWAIMRQESGYDAEVISYADAIGLMQLLPDTAADFARRSGAPFRREMLFDPQWNVRFGARYNRDLLARYDGAAPLAIAAFNGGEHRIDRWLEEQGRPEIDVFVERIPIDQTRNYVRRVMTHYARYLHLSGRLDRLDGALRLAAP